MQLFFKKNINENNFTLDKNESNHICKVLRKKEGEEVYFTDGNGQLITTKILIADINKTHLQVIKRELQPKNHNYYLHIAIAPTKSIDRYKFFIEKATEIGIDEITPIICNRSERKIIKEDRINKIIISAIKQSLKYHMPKLNSVTNFKNFIKRNFKEDKYIAHCNKDVKKLAVHIKSTNQIVMLIGPEGDFSDDEIELALKNNFKPISLGNSRLRTETAGIVATNTINLISNNIT